MITVIIVVYKSDKKKLKEILDQIDESIKVIIIDNSLNYDFGELSLSKNTQVIRSSNIGNGAGINKALESCQTHYALYMDIDVELPNNFIYKFTSFIKKINNFTILVPNHGDSKISDKIVEKYDGEASIMLFNLKKFPNKKIFDENFFLYFEETDLFLNCKKKNLKIFYLRDLSIVHERSSSIDTNLSEIDNLRSWHYMWSMFYFYKKNYSFLFGIKKTYIYLIKDLIMFLYYLLLFNKKKFNIRFFRIYGILCSILGLKSFKR